VSEGTPAAVGWSGLVYFWDGGWIGVARGGGPVPPHAHHAIQISVGLSGRIRMRHDGEEWMDLDVGVVLPDVVHEFHAMDQQCAMIFIDPECAEGRWLRDSVPSPVYSVPAERIAEHVPELRAFERERPSAEGAARLITGVVRSLVAGPPPLKRTDPRIVRALEVIRKGDVRSMPLEEAAKSVYLSPSRFAHLFKEEVGVPFRRYMLWRKLSRAMEEFGRGSNLTNAAHAAGFTDSAHLTRTWRQMFGISPTMMLGRARFYEIPAPFELAT
jgi:AraC-like DNA-binding protein